MKNSSLLIAIISLLTLNACTHTLPVAVIAHDGRVLTGSATASLYNSHFQVSDGKLTCSGNYNGYNTSQTITMPVICDDGRKGFANVYRDFGGNSGHGTVTLKDGYKADFVFGNAAKAF